MIDNSDHKTGEAREPTGHGTNIGGANNRERSYVDDSRNRNLSDAQKEYEYQQKRDMLLKESNIPHHFSLNNPQQNDVKQMGNSNRPVGGALYPVADFQKNVIRIGTSYIYNASMQGTDVGVGMDVMGDMGSLAFTAVSHARKNLAKGMTSDLTRTCDIGTLASNRELKEVLEVLKKNGKTTVLNSFFTKDEMEMINGLLVKEGKEPLKFYSFNKNMRQADRLLAESNAYLQKRGIATGKYRDAGVRMRMNTKRGAFKNRNSLTETDQLIVKINKKANGIKTISGTRQKFRLGRKALAKSRRYVQQCDAGQGIVLITNVISRGRQVLRNGKRATYNTYGIAKFAGKLAYKASLKSAVFLLQTRAGKAIKNTTIARNTTAVVNNLKTKHNNAKVRKDYRKTNLQNSKFVRAINSYKKFRADPFHIRARGKILSQKITKSTVGKGVGMLFKPLNILKSVIGRIASVTATVVSTLISVIMLMVFALIAIVVIVMFFFGVFTSILGAFDFTASDDEIKEAALETIKTQYEAQYGEIESYKTSGAYRSVTVNNKDVRDDEAYNNEEHKPDFPYEETTNSVELLSMATVYFDFDLEDAGKDKVCDYIEKLYNGSHLTSIVTHPYYVSDNKGKVYTYYDADVTLTTYYFNDLFNCSLTSKQGLLAGNTITEQVWNYLRTSGFTETQTAAVMGNIYAESGFDPNVIENGNGIGIGLCQWSYGRRTALENFAATKGKPASDLGVQCEYLVTELTPSSFNDYYMNNSYNVWYGSRSIDEATAAFMWGWERPAEWAGNSSLPKRQTAANEYYAMYHGTTATEKGKKIVDAAISQLGTPYVYGGTTPNKALDCSGLTQYCYAQAGIQIGRTDLDQLNGGTIVNDPQPGDICWTPGHVAIYVGNGQMIEAQQDGVPVCYSPVRADHYVRY